MLVVPTNAIFRMFSGEVMQRILKIILNTFGAIFLILSLIAIYFWIKNGSEYEPIAAFLTGIASLLVFLASFLLSKHKLKGVVMKGNFSGATLRYIAGRDIKRNLPIESDDESETSGIVLNGDFRNADLSEMAGRDIREYNENTQERNN